jgi:hypothetical protein
MSWTNGRVLDICDVAEFSGMPYMFKLEDLRAQPDSMFIAVLLCGQMYNVFELCRFWLDYRLYDAPLRHDLLFSLAELGMLEDWFRGTPRDQSRHLVPSRYFSSIYFRGTNMPL